MRQEEIIIDGKKIFHRTIGKGPDVMLLHGFGEDGSVWENQLNAFPDYRLLVPDLPGSGGSEMTVDMTMEGMAETVLSYVKYLGVRKFTLIGHSMGGYVALALAAKEPEILNGLGLFHSTAFPDSEEKKEIRKKGIEFIRQHGPFEFLKTSIPNLFSPATRETNNRIVQEQIDASHNFSGAALVSYYMSMMQRPDRTEILKTTSLPVLFILGKYDTAVPLDDGLRLCYLPELSYIHILENSAHMGMKEEPSLSNSILTTYLKSASHQTR